MIIIPIYTEKCMTVPNIIRIIKSKRMRWVGLFAYVGERRNTYKILVGKLEGKRPLGRMQYRWEENFQTDLMEISWVWTGLIWHRTGTDGRIYTVMNHWIHGFWYGGKL
jgi:hypothetical protein